MTRQRISEHRALGDAGSLRRERDQKDCVDQRRVVRDDELPWHTKALESADFIGEHSQPLHET